MEAFQSVWICAKTGENISLGNLVDIETDFKRFQRTSIEGMYNAYTVFSPWHAYYLFKIVCNSDCDVRSLVKRVLDCSPDHLDKKKGVCGIEIDKHHKNISIGGFDMRFDSMSEDEFVTLFEFSEDGKGFAWGVCNPFYDVHHEPYEKSSFATSMKTFSQTDEKVEYSFGVHFVKIVSV